MDKAAFQKLLAQDSKGPQWCPGCGDYGELNILMRALAELAAEDRIAHEHAELEEIEEMRLAGLDAQWCTSCPEPHFYPRYESHTVVTDSGIGCAGQMLGYINTYGVKATHGRALPLALGLKLARPDLTVIPQGGDGDALAIGAGHFVNFPARNLDVTYLLTNNEVYGLTKGQTSPSAPVWLKTGVNPQGGHRDAVNPMALAVSAGWTFVARLLHVGKLASGFDTAAFSVEVVKQAIRHQGASLVIFETECPTYNKVKTKEWLKERAVPLAEFAPDHDPASVEQAIGLSLVSEEEQIPVGIYYRVRKPTLHERLGITKPMLNRKPDKARIRKLMERFA